MIYNDRKMLKWQGFFLSEYTEALANGRKQQPINVKEQQTSEVIARQLERSWLSHQPVRIQANISSDGVYQPPVCGQVIGFNGELIYLVSGANQYVITSDDIRHVEQLEVEDTVNGSD